METADRIKEHLISEYFVGEELVWQYDPTFDTPEALESILLNNAIISALLTLMEENVDIREYFVLDVETITAERRNHRPLLEVAE